jgi:hypothetical protein
MVKKTFLAFFFCFALQLQAAPAHQATLKFKPIVTPGATYNVYQALCLGTITAGVCSSEGAFVKIASGIAGSPYHTPALAANTGYVWYLTSLCALPGCDPTQFTMPESLPSDHAAGMTNKDQLAVPISVIISHLQ